MISLGLVLLLIFIFIHKSKTGKNSRRHLHFIPVFRAGLLVRIKKQKSRMSILTYRTAKMSKSLVQ